MTVDKPTHLSSLPVEFTIPKPATEHTMKKNETVLNEEFDKMKHLIGYNKKTQ